jgi:hypothetical protein
MILAGVVHQNNFVNDIVGNLSEGLSHGALGIVSGHNDNNFSAVNHKNWSGDFVNRRSI